MPYERFPDDLTFNYYMLLASVAKGWRFEFFPLSWREEDQVSNVKLTRQALKVLGILCSYVVNRERFLSTVQAGSGYPRYDYALLYMSEG